MVSIQGAGTRWSGKLLPRTDEAIVRGDVADTSSRIGCALVTRADVSIRSRMTPGAAS